MFRLGLAPLSRSLAALALAAAVSLTWVWQAAAASPVGPYAVTPGGLTSATWTVRLIDVLRP